MNVRDLMTADVVVARRETPLKEVARLLIEHRIGGVPVVDDDRRVIGVVSEADFLVKETAVRKPERPGRLSWLLRGPRDRDAEDQRLHAVSAGEAMTSPATVIEAGATIAEAARRMTEGRINRLPVVDADGRLVGIVTRADLVRAFARSDEDLLAEIRHAVSAVDGLTVVDVQDGVATLSGTVSHSAVAESAARVVAAIPGVVAVDDRDLGWTPEEAPPTPPTVVG